MVSIPESIWITYREFADDFINDNFGVNCLLVYPSRNIPCFNCYFDSITNSSSNIYNTSTGTILFTNGTICPVCQGAGFEAVPATDDIKLRVYFRPKDFNTIMPQINVPNGGCMVIGFMADLPNFNRADYIELNTNNNGIQEQRFQRSGEAQPHGFKRDRYFTAVLEKAN